MRKHTTLRPLLIRWYMDFFGYRAFASLWNVIYFKDHWDMHDNKLIRHEEKHIEQMERDGKIVWFFKNYWYWFKYGYVNNPYEIEAKKAEVEL